MQPLRRLRLGAAHIVALAVACQWACGGSAPTAPAPPPTAVVLDGWSGAPLTTAAVTTAATLTVSAPGYLPRTQPPAATIFLWPGDATYVATLVYSDLSPGRLLTRWTTGFTVRVLPELGNSAAWATAQAADATGLPIGVGDGPVEVVVNPAVIDTVSRTALASTSLTVRGNVVIGCRVALRNAGVSRGALLHEVGHCLGLGHSATPGDLMLAREQPGIEVWSPTERVALRMMYRYREPGNAAPDNAP